MAAMAVFDKADHLYARIISSFEMRERNENT